MLKLVISLTGPVGFNLAWRQDTVALWIRESLLQAIDCHSASARSATLRGSVKSASAAGGEWGLASGLGKVAKTTYRAGVRPTKLASHP